jgi:hypothetical protein
MASGDVALQVDGYTVHNQNTIQTFDGGDEPTSSQYLATGMGDSNGTEHVTINISSGSQILPGKLSGAKSYTVKFIEN